MEKITIKNLIDFRRKNERTRITFVNNLKKEKVPQESSGGDYWISCLSAIANAYKYENKDLLEEKIELLREKVNFAKDKRIKDQFQRNIDVLLNFQDFDLQYIRPSSELTFLKQPKLKSIIDIGGLNIQSKPSHIFSFSENNSEEIGGVWFVAKLNGFKKAELGMFADIIYRYLKKHYSEDFYVNSKYCIAIDLFNGQEVNYSEIENNEIPTLIDSTIEEIKGF
ncbi:hypothetical protein J2Q11_14080 [Tenacibaculum finnmarkense genomovar finnmarkense]|uniref:hypothetical protein n=1 Tax=Tenacibaculum finnmarkense TaxID=2781243 RepID=UPI000C6BB554|nr:hypothetical protein [Tenacibaculum finnmarkense]MCD8418856.1 hypothetical protein [Tenacibaculum finnmarkense genomovar finnmarkense]MCD8440866.1 hypothetical protein [Tenacibaculum finnmarkense genomovar ulcerans]MCG8187146.1 hypothetical protein [Tenacibaculum finnmarkense genomovar finnmarkense]MCG8211201.1 hypothetical protein [Tenacibaculum finnmarkense genomovar finnmarkense]MCG8213942.1 hypothetical protein [Tenacibaculum finnmarkense genomovar finnmarkense]